MFPNKITYFFVTTSAVICFYFAAMAAGLNFIGREEMFNNNLQSSLVLYAFSQIKIFVSYTNCNYEMAQSYFIILLW